MGTMKKIVLLLFVLFIIGCTYTVKNLEGKCCIKCQDSFSQSPVGVGEQAAKCWEFTSAKELSTECKEFFSEKPMTVKECSGWNNE